MDDLDLHLALEALRTNPAAHTYHERITRGMQAIAQGTLTPFDRDVLHRLLERFPSATPSPDPITALIAAFQRELPNYDPAAVATAIQHALAQRPATLNGAPVTIRMDGDTHAHQANLAIGNQVGGNLVQVTVTIPIPDARFDALLATALKTHEQEKTLARIRHAAQQIESDRLLNLRLEGFVGRVAELAAIREHIATMRLTGGYVLIKAAAGEGKSSSIAKLIQEAGIAATPHHFIALTTGREYQLGLLRAVVAQLILKHGLTVSYFPEASYPAMKAEFARILDELSKHGIAETIYLDGLDQLQPEIDGSRDLSFLPPQPPPGIVIVLGSRPDETLKPLEILHRVDYDLPPLSEADALALWRSVQPGVADSLLHDLYTALKGNALFVHLAADTMHGQSIVDATSLIRQIEQNPSNLFGIALDRMKGRSMADWRTIWKPMLALLLVAQEPLRLDVLGDLLEQDHDTMQDAVWVFGGLVSQGIDQRVALHHLLFRDYLATSVFNPREVKCWQQRLADWCAVDLDSIWADDRDPIEHARRVYARHHYITHLSLAENWTTLWQVLDAGDYGEQKTRFDPSTRLYVLDLDRGRESAIKAGQSDKEHIQHLPRLWKYSLLRTSLNNRLDQWPDELFVVLAMLGRTQEALERVELCSDSERQLCLWQKLLIYCDPVQQAMIAHQVRCLGIDGSDSASDTMLASMGKILTHIGAYAEAYTYVSVIDDTADRISALVSLAQACITIGDRYSAHTLLAEAQPLARAVEGIKNQADTLVSLAPAVAAINDMMTATTILEEAKSLIGTIRSVDDRLESLAALAYAFVAINDMMTATTILEEAKSLIGTIRSVDDRLEALVFLSLGFAITGDSDIANETLAEATSLMQEITNEEERTRSIELLALVSCRHITKALTLSQAIYAIDEDGLPQLLSLIATSGIGSQHTIHTCLHDAYNALKITVVNPQNRIKVLILLAAIAAGSNNRIIDPIVSEAHRLINDLSDPDDKARSFALIAAIKGTVGDHTAASRFFVEATIAARDNENIVPRIVTLTAMAKSFTIYNGHEYAIAIVDKAVEETTTTIHVKMRAHILSFLVKDYLSLDCFGKARTIAKMIDDQAKRVSAFIAIAQEYSKRGQAKDAIAMLDTIKDDIQFFENTFFKDIPEHISNITNMAIIYAAHGCHDYAVEMLNQATQYARSILHEKSREYLFALLVQPYVSIGHGDQAMAIAQSIHHLDTRINAYITIAQSYSKGGQQDKVLTTLGSIMSDIQSIENPTSRLSNLTTLAELYASNGQDHYAITLLETIISEIRHSNTENSHQAWASIAHVYASLGNIDRAIAIAQTIDDPYTRASINIRISQTRTATLHPILMDTILNDLSTIVHSISLPIFRIQTLLYLIKHNHPHWIRLIQTEWQKEKNQDDLWRLLQTITPFLNQYPWLFSSIIETEEWVNEQLKRLG